MNKLSICQTYYTYAKEIGGVKAINIFNRLEKIGFIGNDELDSKEFVGEALALYDRLCNNSLPINLVNFK